jgi:hypothetical protein
MEKAKRRRAPVNPLGNALRRFPDAAGHSRGVSVVVQVSRCRSTSARRQRRSRTGASRRSAWIIKWNVSSAVNTFVLFLSQFNTFVLLYTQGELFRITSFA